MKKKIKINIYYVIFRKFISDEDNSEDDSFYHEDDDDLDYI